MKIQTPMRDLASLGPKNFIMSVAAPSSILDPLPRKWQNGMPDLKPKGQLLPKKLVGKSA